MFGFETFEHKNFQNNFLKTVIFQLSYSRNNNFKNKAKEIRELFEEKFPRQKQIESSGVEITFNNQTPLVNQTKEDGGLEFKSNDGQKVLTITDTLFSLTCSGRVYENFQNLKESLTNISSFFELCKIDTINKLAIRKINIVEFKNEINPSEILSLLINEDLLGNLKFFPNPQNIDQNIQSLSYKSDNNYLIIKYGLNIPQPQNDLGHVLIDIDLVAKDKINCNNLFNNADEINTEIFNVFCWVTSDFTKKLLNDGKAKN